MKNPFIKYILVFFTGIIISRIFWFLGFFPNLFRGIIDPGNCTRYDTMTIQMYVCSAIVAFKMLIGPLFFMFLIFIFRKLIFRIIKGLLPKIPADFRFLMYPSVATFIFTILWAGSHFETGDTMGILGQHYFPVIAGLFTFTTTEYYSVIQKKLENFFVKRDRISKFTRYLIAFLIPLFLSLIITLQHRVSSVAIKEQFIVIVSMISGYLVLIPKKGTLNLNKLK